jgi:hypothetical protein
MLLVHLQGSGGDADFALGLLDPVSGSHAGDLMYGDASLLYSPRKFPGR